MLNPVVVVLVFACVVATKVPQFYTRYDVDDYRQYFDPNFAGSKHFFARGRPTNNQEVYICAGFGRTSTTTLSSVFKKAGVYSIHEHTPVTKLPMYLQASNTLANMFDGVSRRDGSALGTVALLDNPTGIYTHEIREAFPNSTVVLGVRNPDQWVQSLHRLLKEQGGWPPGDVNERTFHVVSFMPPHRHALRRFFEVNNYIIATTPEDSLFVVDIPAGNSAVVFAKLFHKDPDQIVVRHSHNSAGSSDAAAPPPVVHVAHPPLLSDSANPSRLNLHHYVRPIPMGKFHPTEAFYAPKHKMSTHPLVIGAGFEGTGLTVLSQVLTKLGKSKQEFPPLDLDNKPNTKAYFNSDILTSMYRHGLQGNFTPPAMWDRADAIMGHPTPTFIWDFFEGFPKAKVILTVRNADEWLHTVNTLAPNHGFSHSGKSVSLLNTILWGEPAGPQVTDKDRLSAYFQSNAKVIFGIPKSHLLVWDVYKNPSWKPICEFLDVPIPNEPFPKVDSLEW